MRNLKGFGTSLQKYVRKNVIIYKNTSVKVLYLPRTATCLFADLLNRDNMKTNATPRLYKFNPPIAIRTSLSDYRQEDWLVNIPLYAISSLANVAQQHQFEG